MDTFTAIETRRSIKSYDPDYKISEDEIKRLLQLTLLAPTSFNIQHWRFIRVRDSEIRKQLRDAAWDQEQVTDASELFIVCADINAWSNSPQRYWQNLPTGDQDYIVSMLTDFYQGRAQLQRDEAMRSCGIAAQTLMLAANAMGYGTCPMIGFDADKVAQIINLPDGYAIGLMISLGKPTKPAWPRGGQLDYEEVVVENRFA